MINHRKTRFNITQLVAILALTLTALTVVADESLKQAFSLNYQRFTLDNGLTVVIHQDRKAPIVAVNVWYHVGSKDEEKGRTGLAHLFEHLMFNGSENYNDDWFKAFDRVGATGLNGTTNQDRTNYFQVVPKNALAMTLWMESDRMGHLLGAIDQAKLDEQRDVVKNEKRQSENQPYGSVFQTILQNVFPANHPYSWSPIGSMEDLEAASLDDIKAWFKQQYGAANATLVIAGDVEVEPTLALVKKYFGHIESGPPLSKQTQWIAKRTGTHVQETYDRVPQARVYKIWNVPEWGSAEADYLGVASAVLSSDKRSRLYNRLVYNEQIASDVSAFSFNSEIAGLFGIIATAINEADLSRIEAAIDEELALFLEKGPTKDELKRIRNGITADAVRGLESVGGFSGKSDILARGQVFAGDPNAFVTSLIRSIEASPETVRDTARDWLSDGEYVLRVLPFAEYQTTPSTVDRSAGLPPVGEAPEVKFDRLERAQSEKGLDVILAQRDAVPAVNMSLLFSGGFAADTFQKPGVASLTMSMLDEGTSDKDALEISSELAELGTLISSRAGLNSVRIQMNSLTSTLDESMALFAEIALDPAFPQSELSRLKQQQLVAITREQSSPMGMAYRALPKVLYGENHPYSNPFSGSGNPDSVASIEASDLERYHQQWFTASNGTLIVTGDITMDELMPLVNRHFGKLSQAQAPSLDVAATSLPEQPQVFIIDRPESQQSSIIVSKLVPEYGFSEELALQMANEVLGGSFNARLNMNLRENKGWSYGANSSVPNIKGQRPFMGVTSVQGDKTAEAVAEIFNELNQITDDALIQPSELARALDKDTLTLPGRWETASALLADITSMVTFDLSEAYWDSYAESLRALTLEDVQATADRYFGSKNSIWVIVGDASQIMEPLQALELGEIKLITSEGELVQ